MRELLQVVLVQEKNVTLKSMSYLPPSLSSFLSLISLTQCLKPPWLMFVEQLQHLHSIFGAAL